MLFIIFLITSIWHWLHHWRTHGGRYVCDGVVSEIQFHKLENHNMPRFFQHWRILLKLLLWLLLMNSFYCQAYMLCIYRNCRRIFTNIFCLLLNFSSSWKSCVKEHWPNKSIFSNCWLNVMICDLRPKKRWNMFESLKSW